MAFDTIINLSPFFPIWAAAAGITSLFASVQATGAGANTPYFLVVIIVSATGGVLFGWLKTKR